jgi:hypothetical protein
MNLSLVIISLPLLLLESQGSVWNVPINPDPQVILNEAETDAKAGRYQEALAKHVWFHQHALEHRPSLYGVRLTTALLSWHDLGKAYVPAMKKLEEARDAAANVVIGRDDDILEAFQEMRAINEQIGQEEKTVATFVTLDKQWPEKAKKVYEYAEPALVKAKEFALCGKYLEPSKAIARTLELHRAHLKYAEAGESLADKRLHREIAEADLLETSATLVALLVLNERRAEADTIANKVKTVSKHPDQEFVISGSLKGSLPKRSRTTLFRFQATKD